MYKSFHTKQVQTQSFISVNQAQKATVALKLVFLLTKAYEKWKNLKLKPDYEWEVNTDIDCL